MQARQLRFHPPLYVGTPSIQGCARVKFFDAPQRNVRSLGDDETRCPDFVPPPPSRAPSTEAIILQSRGAL